VHFVCKDERSVTVCSKMDVYPVDVREVRLSVHCVFKVPVQASFPHFYSGINGGHWSLWESTVIMVLVHYSEKLLSCGPAVQFRL